ncbi:hypothetical protein HD806DRAFT_4312 [Xylariaceae sp. AK1471]|nr:hypothetical protein HD806DRAFT_4312 [Xylariaceae sp. AK1471]
MSPQGSRILGWTNLCTRLLGSCLHRESNHLEVILYQPIMVALSNVIPGFCCYWTVIQSVYARLRSPSSHQTSFKLMSLYMWESWACLV